MNQACKDLTTFYNSLPSWAQSEFQALLQLVDQGEIDGGELATGIQNLMNRVEHAQDLGGSAYLQ